MKNNIPTKTLRPDIKKKKKRERFKILKNINKKTEQIKVCIILWFDSRV